MIGDVPKEPLGGRRQQSVVRIATSDGKQSEEHEAGTQGGEFYQ